MKCELLAKYELVNQGTFLEPKRLQITWLDPIEGWWYVSVRNSCWAKSSLSILVAVIVSYSIL